MPADDHHPSSQPYGAHVGFTPLSVHASAMSPALSRVAPRCHTTVRERDDATRHAARRHAMAQRQAQRRRCAAFIPLSRSWPKLSAAKERVRGERAQWYLRSDAPCAHAKRAAFARRSRHAPIPFMVRSIRCQRPAVKRYDVQT